MNTSVTNPDEVRRHFGLVPVQGWQLGMANGIEMRLSPQPIIALSPMSP